MHYTYKSHNIGLSLYSLNFTHQGGLSKYDVYFTRGGQPKCDAKDTNTKRERPEALKAPKMDWGRARLIQLVGQTPFWTALFC